MPAPLKRRGPSAGTKHPAPELADRLVFLLVIAAATVVPVVVVSRHLNPFRVPKELLLIAIAMSIVAVVVIALLLRATTIVNRLRRFKAALVLGGAGMAWTLVTSLTATNRALVVRADLWAATAIVLTLATMVTMRDRGVGWAAAPLAPAVVNSAVLLLQATRVWQPMAFPPGLDARMLKTALVGNPDDVGAYCVPLTLLAAALAAGALRHRAVFAAIALIVTAALFATESFTAMAALGAGLVVMLFLIRPRWAIVGMVALPLAALAVVRFYKPLGTRVSHLVHVTLSGDIAAASNGRLVPYAAAWEMFLKRPLIGVGPGCFRFEYMPYRFLVEAKHPSLTPRSVTGTANAGDAHNDHLQLLAETGLPGYALFIAALVVLGAISFRARGSPGSERGRVARLLACPLAVALSVEALAQFPMHLGAPLIAFLFVGGTALAWQEYVA